MAPLDDAVEKLSPGAQLHDQMHVPFVFIGALQARDVCMASQVVHDFNFPLHILDVLWCSAANETGLKPLSVELKHLAPWGIPQLIKLNKSSATFIKKSLHISRVLAIPHASIPILSCSTSYDFLWGIMGEPSREEPT